MQNKVLEGIDASSLHSRFQMSYSKHEVPLIIPMELELMDDLGCDRSGVHKSAIKMLYREIKKAKYLVWYGDFRK